MEVWIKEAEEMKEQRISLGKRAFVTIMSAMMVLTVLVFVDMPKASAAPDEWTEETDTDFQDSFGAGFFSNVVLQGTGAPAYIELNKTVNWLNMNPASPPISRESFGFAFDSKNNRAILFGGWNGTVYLNDTWAYDYGTNMWTQLRNDGEIQPNPPRRAGCGMVYDSTDEVIVLYGGFNPSIGILNDTWEFNVNTNIWNDTTPPKGFPNPSLVNVGLAYDDVADMTVLAGSLGWDPGAFETWVYEATAQSWANRTSGTQPEPRTGHALAFNGVFTVLQGGAPLTPDPLVQWHDDTWLYAYGNDTWFEMEYNYLATPPRPSLKVDYAMARYFDGVMNIEGKPKPPMPIMIYEQYNLTPPYNKNDWNDLTSTAFPPIPARSGHEMVWDSFNKVLILFGGVISTSPSPSDYLNETYVYGAGYVSSGWYVSKVGAEAYYDSGSPLTTWQNISWNISSPPPLGTKLKFQLEVGNISDPAMPDPDRITFCGPNGNASLYYETPGEAIWSGLSYHRYIRYKAFFEGTPANSPQFHNITISYSTVGPPYIKSTDPVDNDVDVPLWKNITVVFSKTMNTSSLLWTISPDPCPGLWSTVWGTTTKTDDTVTLNHPVAYNESQKYMVTVTNATDLTGSPLDAASGEPNPWNFTTMGIKPYLSWTDPYDNETGIALDKNIIVQFSETMIDTTVDWTVSPPIPPKGDYTVEWGNSNSTFFLNHSTLLLECQEYVIKIISGVDMKGNPLDNATGEPNPWRFFTICPAPYVLARDPEHTTTGVPTDKNIIITFSKEMNTPTVTWYVDTNMNGPGLDFGWTESWESGNTTLNISHSIAFAGGTQYWVNVTYGEDLFANSLNRTAGMPRWWFETEVLGPWLVSTDPANATTGVALDKDIEVVFSEAIDTTTLVWSINPPEGGVWTEEWSSDNITLYLNHSLLFTENQTYDVQIACNDTSGNPLDPGKGVPNPWWFKTGGAVPYIVTTVPYDGETDVVLGRNIEVTFSEAINTATYTWTINPLVPGSWTEEWSAGDTVLYLNHTNPYAMFTTYTVEITFAEDLSGLPLGPGPVPNPWAFTTITGAPYNLEVERAPPDMIINWDPVPGAIMYSIYESQDSFAAWPWALLGTSGVPTYTHVGGHDDGLTHFYIVRAFNGVVETENSTMGAKAHLSFTQPVSPMLTDINWLSLPYNSIYATASDIANELTDAKIRAVGKWDPAKQKAITYTYAKGKWRGVDFPISPGDGIFIAGLQQDFDWVINGTDSEITLNFVHYPKYTKNTNWISVPYTGIYNTASSIVIDIEGSLMTVPGKIVEVGKWNATTQTAETFYWDGGAWIGTDFTIEAGDGIYIQIISSFGWMITLLTPTVP